MLGGGFAAAVGGGSASGPPIPRRPTAATTAPGPTPGWPTTTGNAALDAARRHGLAWRCRRPRPPRRPPRPPWSARRPLAARENFAFAPYWTLGQSPTFDLDGLSTLAYFSVGVNPDGTLDESGPGWNGFQSQDLADLITRAHAAGRAGRATVNDFGQSSLDALTSSPTAAGTLSAALIPLLQAKNLDGVNFDFEGDGRARPGRPDRPDGVGLGALRAADPHWQITMDTYASSAGDTGGFYNIPALAPSVDAFFVMAYELNLAGAASAASPSTSGMFSDQTTLEQYTPPSRPPRSSWARRSSASTGRRTTARWGPRPPGGPPTSPTRRPRRAAGPQYWDPVTETAWTSYQAGAQWHESYYEGPYGLYDVAQMAAQSPCAGRRHLGARHGERRRADDRRPRRDLARAGAGHRAPVHLVERPRGAPRRRRPARPQRTRRGAGPAGRRRGDHHHQRRGRAVHHRARRGRRVRGERPRPRPRAGVDHRCLQRRHGRAEPDARTRCSALVPAGTLTDFPTKGPAWACLNGKTLAVYTTCGGAGGRAATPPTASPRSSLPRPDHGHAARGRR